ncbi:MAG: sugar ABC transporter substrate-binding protein [Anaerolineales bacterium]|nr:sugar ABC transporter substrate-binding protein [Anaerolineales bacterium]
MSKARSQVQWALSLVLIASTLLTACAPTVVTQVVTAPPQVVTQQVEVEVTRQVDVTTQVEVTAQPGLLPYGLLPGKPFNGTKLKFLICCQSAAQFFLLNQKSLAFTELTGIEVEWGNVPFGEFQTLTQQEGATGAGGWDLVTWVDVWGPGLFDTVLPLDELAARDGYDLTDFPEAYLAPGRNKDGQQVGIPFRGHAFTLFYRQDLYDQLGLKVPTTWAELEANAKAIQAANPDIAGLAPYYGVAGGQNMFLWQSLLWSNGGDLFDENWKPIFNNAAGVEATQRYVDWLIGPEPIAPVGAVDFNEQAGQTDLSQGRSAQFIGWSWMYGNFINPTLAVTDVVGNVAFAPPPGWEGKGSPATYGYIWEVGIYKNSPNTDAAWEYLKWMTNAENEKRVALDHTDPRFINVVVVHKSNMADPEINALYDNLQENMLAILDNARGLPMLPEYLQIQAILEVAINEMANGAPVQETLDTAAADVENLLSLAGYY